MALFVHKEWDKLWKKRFTKLLERKYQNQFLNSFMTEGDPEKPGTSKTWTLKNVGNSWMWKND